MRAGQGLVLCGIYKLEDRQDESVPRTATTRTSRRRRMGPEASQEHEAQASVKLQGMYTCCIVLGKHHTRQLFSIESYLFISLLEG